MNKRNAGRILESLLGIIAVAAAVLYRVQLELCQPDYKDRFQWAKNLTEGLLPYRDFNMLQTPLSLYYYSIFFRFSHSLHTGLLAASLLIVLTGVFLFLIARRINRKALYLPAALWTVFSVLGQGAIYTSMSVLLWSAALYLYFSYRDRRTVWKLLVIGMLCGMCFFAKQNIGALCAFSLGLCFIYHWARTKTPLKTALVHICCLLGSYAACWGIWLLWFVKCGILRDFADSCLFSAGAFTAAHGGLSALSYLGFNLAAILAVGLLLKQPEIALTGFFMTLIAYPIYNNPCIFPSYSMFAVLLASLKMPENSGKIRKVLYAAAGIIGYLTAFYELAVAQVSCRPDILYRKLRLGDARVVMETENGDIKTAVTFLEEHFGDGLLPYLEAHRAELSDYHIADTLGAFYNIYFDRYDQYYDLFLSGNLGSKTPQDVVDETIRNESGHYFIVWADPTDPDPQSVPGFQDDAVMAAIDSIRQRCILTETLYQAGGVYPSYSIYQIP